MKLQILLCFQINTYLKINIFEFIKKTKYILSIYIPATRVSNFKWNILIFVCAIAEKSKAYGFISEKKFVARLIVARENK